MAASFARYSAGRARGKAWLADCSAMDIKVAAYLIFQLCLWSSYMLSRLLLSCAVIFTLTSLASVCSADDVKGWAGEVGLNRV